MKENNPSIRPNNLIVGRNPVLEALEKGIEMDKVYLQVGVRGEFEKAVRNACKRMNVPMTVVPKEKLNTFFRGNHQGVIAVASIISYQQLEQVLPLAYEDTDAPLFVMLDKVTDVRNFGAIARSAEVFGAHAIIIPKKGSAIINEEAVKASAGALMNIPVCREQSLKQSVEYLKDSGVRVFCADLSGKDMIHDCDFSGPTCLVMGAEDKGINPDLLLAVADRFKIPQVGQTDSLNVSVATGIILYEVRRQRMSL